MLEIALINDTEMCIHFDDSLVDQTEYNANQASPSFHRSDRFFFPFYLFGILPFVNLHSTIKRIIERDKIRRANEWIWINITNENTADL